MQGNPRALGPFLRPLVVGVFTGSIVTAASLSLIQRVIGSAQPSRAWLLPTMSISVLLAMGDLLALRRQKLYPSGPRRQAMQGLMFSRLSWRSVAFAWGFDAGLGLTTYRVTSGVWIFVLWALVGYADATLFVGYGVGFGFGLFCAARFARMPVLASGGDDIERRRAGAMARAQVIYLATLGGTGIALAGGVAGL